MMIITKIDRIEAKKVIDKFNIKKSDEDVFYNLCFAILAPQTTFKSNIKTISALRKIDFYRNDIDIPLLQEIVKSTRFYRIKANRLIMAKGQFRCILKIIRSDKSSIEKRNILVSIVNGLGMKAGSHLLRNLGHKDLAIIDTHIIKYLGCDTPSNAKKYINIEKDFINLARRHGITPAELDAIIWKKYSNTPWEKFGY